MMIGQRSMQARRIKFMFPLLLVYSLIMIIVLYVSFSVRTEVEKLHGHLMRLSDVLALCPSGAMDAEDQDGPSLEIRVVNYIQLPSKAGSYGSESLAISENDKSPY